MDWKAKLIKALGLDSEADDAAIETALKAKLKAADAKPEKAEQSQDVQMSEQSVLENPTFIALQAEHTALAGKFDALSESVARDKATAFVDGAIAEGCTGVKPARDEYIAMHMEDPARAQKLIAAMPKLSGSTHAQDVPDQAGESGLSEADRSVIALMGLDEEEYKESLAASGTVKEAL